MVTDQAFPLHAGPLGKRDWERMEYQAPMELSLPDGRRFTGTSKDVSLGGLFLLLPTRPDNLAVGARGTIHIHNDQSVDLSFPCKVMRLSDEGVALSFQDKQSAFGVYVTHDMMLELLSRINNSFANSTDLQDTLNTAVANIQKYLQAEGASIFMLEQEGRKLVCRACAGPVDITGMILNVNEGIVGRSVRENRSVIVHDTVNDSDFAKKVDEATGYETKALLCVPIRINNRVIGALEVINKRGAGIFVGQDQVVLTALASATGMAIHNARQSDALIKHGEELEETVQRRTRQLSEANHIKDEQIQTILEQKQALEKEIKERRLAEQALKEARHKAEAAARVKSDFLANMSHEIRTRCHLAAGHHQRYSRFFQDRDR